MHDVHDVEEAERMGRARSRIFFVLAIVFFLGQSLYFASSPATRDSHARIGAWLILVILMLMLLATGGFLLRAARCATCSTTKRRATTALPRRRWAFG